MRTTRRTRRAGRLWRWRASPLRRRSDRAEAWIILAAWLLALLAGLATGCAAGAWVADSLAERRAAVHPVSAVLTENAPKAIVTAYGTDGMVWARVRWTGADGVTHTDRAKVERGKAAGARVTVWLDAAGNPVTRPPDAAESRLQAAVVGVPAGLGASVLVLVGGRLVRDRLDRRRYREWDAEWLLVEPQWRRRMIG
ncbi:Rv1733c family protein [Streptomyces sp. 7R007]